MILVADVQGQTDWQEERGEEDGDHLASLPFLSFPVVM